MYDIITRKGAKALGLTRYYTGKPCKRGHVGERQVSNGGCVTCNRERQATADHKAYNRAWHLANRDYDNSVNRAWYEANRDRVKATSKAWAQANSDRRKACMKAWREANRGSQRVSNRAWEQANPEKVRAKDRNRRARKRSAEGSHTAQEIQTIYAAQQGLCSYCKVEVGTNYHVDHIQPLSRGGSNSKDNLQITCPTCNMRKHTKTHEEFLAELKLDIS